MKFDSQPYKDEEMYERAFGKLLHSNEDSEEQSAPTAPESAIGSSTSRTKTAVAVAETLGDGKGQGVTTSEGDKSDDGKKGKNNNSYNAAIADASTTNINSKSRSGTLSQDSADDSPADEASRLRASAREARSRRRQAMIDETTIVPGTEVLAGKRKLPPPPGHRSKQYKNNDYSEEGEVVKVKLLTGTLYLYRGEQRRVEFVRRV